MHVDERAFILYPLGFWAGDLNPHFFNYPTLQLYITSCLYYLYYLLFCNETLDYFIAYRYFVEANDLIAIARGTNALVSAATAVVGLHLGHRLYGPMGGLIAGLLLAIMPLQTRFAYLAITDVSAAFWCALALLYAVRIIQRSNRMDLALSGVWAGLAAACKYPAGLVLVPVLASCWLCRDMRRLAWIPIVTSGLVFAVTSPYILLDWSAFWHDFSAMGQDHLLGGHANSNTTSWYYMAYPNLRYGLGWASLLLLFAAPWYPRTLWRNEEWVLLTCIVAFCGLLIASESTFMRYALPLGVPLAALMARPLFALAQQRALLGVCVLLLIAEPLHSSMRFRSLLAGDDTRALARNWLLQHAPDNRYIFQVPKGGGQALLLNPTSVYARMSQYRDSFGSARLVQAFDLLAEGPPLPPMYFDRYLAPGWIPDEWRHNLYRAQTDSTNGTLWTLFYRYHLPLSPFDNQELYDSFKSLIQRRQSFSVGAPELATFSNLDEYFVPLGGWEAVRATGPEIEIGALPWVSDGPAPTARQTFAALALALKGEQMMQREDWQGAAMTYTALQQVPYNLGDALAYSLLLSVYFGRAKALETLGDTDGAYAAWAAAAARFPDLVEPFFQMGLLAGDARRYSRAIEHYLSAHQLAPEDAVILYNLGSCLLHEGRFDQTILALTRAIELAPDADSYLLLARAHLGLDQAKQAHSAVERAASIDPRHPQLQQLDQILTGSAP